LDESGDYMKDKLQTPPN